MGDAETALLIFLAGYLAGGATAVLVGWLLPKDEVIDLAPEPEEPPPLDPADWWKNGPRPD